VASDVIAQYNWARPLVPSDTIDLTGPTDAIWVGGSGIVVAVFENGQTANFTCTAGQILPLKVKRVNATATTATLLNALYRV
jgi:hypothetical protein